MKLPHLWKNELPVDMVAQLDVHWAIRGETLGRNFIIFG